MIYFARLPTGDIKIGFTDTLTERLSNLRSIYGHPVTALATMPGGRDEEHDMHRRFAHLLVKGREIFRAGEDLMEFIKPLGVSSFKRVELKVSSDAYYWIRVEAAKAQMSMAQYARKVVEEAAKRRSRKAPEE